METVEINGIKYRRKEEDLVEPKITSRMLSLLAMTAGLGVYPELPERKRPTVNLVEEYKLIQLKQSKLSRSNRELVVRMFEKMYKKVEL